MKAKLIISMQVLLFLLILLILRASGTIGGNGIRCLEKERLALLKIKDDLIDEDGILSTWGPEEHKKDCCKWHGVRCDNRTNHVVGLDLFDRIAILRGKISPSLLELDYLKHLDLSANDFNETSIPEFIGSLAKLQYLDLGDSHFSGLIPHHIGNLSMLRHLDLGFNWSLNITDLDWLCGFHSLEYLDLSANDFNETSIPEFIGSLAKLQYLDLGFSNFSGLIPHHIGNLSMLRHLGLGFNWSLNITDLDWLCGFHSLEYLDLSDLDFSRATTWMQAINKLPSLKALHLSQCSFPSTLSTSLPSINSSSSLSFIDLSHGDLTTTSILIRFLNMSSSFTYIDFRSNDMKGKIPDALGNLESLSHVDLSSNMLGGGIPDTLGNLKSLSHVDLSLNLLEGRIPGGLWNSTLFQYLDLGENLLSGSLPHMLRLPYLETLRLHGNRFVGSVPDLASCTSLAFVELQDNGFNGTLTRSIGSLSKLQALDLRSNHLEGTINEAHFSNCSQLHELDFSLNLNLRVMINSHWKPPFKFQSTGLAFCNLGPKFPYWLLHAHGQGASLDISHAQISDTIDKKFWDNSICFSYLNMSNNQISGVAPDLTCATLQYVDLSSNEFNGPLPLLSQNLAFIDLARNKLSGRLTHICAASGVTILGLSDNRLSGRLPHCLKNLTQLRYFNLANNNFSGKIPKSLGYLFSLLSLHLRNNSLRGEIPTLLSKCVKLRVLDLGENNLTGHVPAWIGGSFPFLAVLSLKSNEFYGSLPSTLCDLKTLQVLDLSSNKISGTIPNCINNFNSMSLSPKFNPEENHFSQLQVIDFPHSYDEINIVWKGEKVEFFTNLILLKAIDLSSNKLVGEIPNEITSLDGLFSLNLSRNNLSGFIPQEICQLELLNSLDLSENNLSGHVPDTLSRMSHLGVMNLSFNNLSGRIPWNTHVQTFDSSSYIGNPELCGPPLSKPCPEDERPKKSISTENVEETDNDELITIGFYISMTLGFIFGFWGVFGTSLLNKSWGPSCFKMVINVNDRVHLAVKWNHLRKYFYN